MKNTTKILILVLSLVLVAGVIGIVVYSVGGRMDEKSYTYLQQDIEAGNVEIGRAHV